MANLVLLYLTVFGILNELVASARVANSTKMIASKRGVKYRYRKMKHGVNLGLPRNITYFINPKGYSHYEEQFAKIRNIGQDINCKLRGKCLGLKRQHIIESDINQNPFKKSFSDNSRVPDNSNEVVSQSQGMHHPGAELGPQVMANDRRYSHQPNAADFGQQPQMNLMPSPMGGGPSGPPDEMSQMRETADNNDAMIQNSIQNKMEFSDRANGPMQMGGRNGGSEDQPDGYMGSGMRHHRRHRYDESAKDKSSSGLPSDAPVSDEDMYKAEGVQPNEMSDLHNFLHHDGPKSKSKDDIDRDEDYDEGGKGGGNMSPEERAHGRHHEPSSFNEDEEERNSDNFDERDNRRRHHNEHEDGFKAAGIEVPNLSNLMGGGMPLMDPNGLSEHGMGHRGNDMEDNHGRFMPDNNRNMMESNSDYSLPKSGRKKHSNYENERHEGRNYGNDKHLGMTNRGFKAMESFHGRHHDQDNHGMKPIRKLGMMHENYEGDDEDNNEMGESEHDDGDDGDDEGDYGHDNNDYGGHDHHHRRSFHNHNHGHGQGHDHGRNHVRGHVNAGHGSNIQNMHASRGPDDYSMNPINDMAALQQHDRKGSIPQVDSNLHEMPKFQRQSGITRGIAPVARQAEFANLWKDYMLTTQSQLAERDPSVNNRGRIHRLDTHRHASYHDSRKNVDNENNRDVELHRWKKSNVGTSLNEASNSSATHANETAKSSAWGSGTNVTQSIEVKNSSSIMMFNNSISNASESSQGTKNNNESKPLAIVKRSSELRPLYLTKNNGEKMFEKQRSSSAAGRRNYASRRWKYPYDNENFISPEGESNGRYNALGRSNIYGGVINSYISNPVVSPLPKRNMNEWSTVNRDKVLYPPYQPNTKPSQNLSNQLDEFAPFEGYPGKETSSAFSSVDKISPDDLLTNSAFRSVDKTSPDGLLTNSATRSIDKTSPDGLPTEIQNLVRKFVTGKGGSNDFNYAPSSDEINQELNFAENTFLKSRAKEEDGKAMIHDKSPVSNLREGSRMLSGPGFSRENHESYFPASMLNKDARWNNILNPSRGSRRSDAPIAFTKDHVGFGPITVEAKTADAPPDDPLEG